MQFSRLATTLAITTLTGFTWACATRPSPISSAPATSIAPSQRFEWPGTYDLVGQGFPEGERRATLIVERRDTTLLSKVEGPPGLLVSSRFAGDSAEFVWSLPTDLMYVEVQGTGDRLTGQWTIGQQKGVLLGTRRK